MYFSAHEHSSPKLTDAKNENECDKACRSDTQVVDTESDLRRPQREQTHGNCSKHCNNVTPYSTSHTAINNRQNIPQCLSLKTHPSASSFPISQLPNLCMGTSGTPLQYVIVNRLGAFFYWTRFIRQQCTVRQYHSNLSDQSAVEIRVRIRVRLRVVLF